MEAYVDQSLKLIQQFHELAAEGNYAKAGELLWGALMSALNALASSKGRTVTSHADARALSKSLTAETGDEALWKAFRAAETMHANFYHRFLEPEDIVEDAKLIEDSVKKLIALAKQSSA